ncbi:Uncharacterized conserved protein, DUF305 family [Nocardia amikacinitolerans]|uniref:Uncharacterized conserved protein, DUF305 family n=1 Tax=Nocardia amikacinitolerans TaxID=756689 RepID=A0A285LBY1_9NOCA|nr:DUF305 domain-containing protein [Nocardia amikacinitolerans]SNY80891.1 Uncharacterized conserved protein, DUF305 family [Nocardia amikacinitolerans]
MFITRTRLTIAALASGALLFAAGCGDDSDSMSGMDHGAASSTTAAATSAARTDFNNADVTFLQMMYPHHAQAVEMAKLVPSHTENPQLRALAAEVEKAQAPEMEQISTLLQSFGKPAPTAGGGHEGHGMPGMMSAEQMTALQAASGPAFDEMWLEMMIEHHTGAIDMAKTELADGVNPEAQALARAVIAAQESEIATMRGMLGQN